MQTDISEDGGASEKNKDGKTDQQSGGSTQSMEQGASADRNWNSLGSKNTKAAHAAEAIKGQDAGHKGKHA